MGEILTAGVTQCHTITVEMYEYYRSSGWLRNHCQTLLQSKNGQIILLLYESLHHPVSHFGANPPPPPHYLQIDIQLVRPHSPKHVPISWRHRLIPSLKIHTVILYHQYIVHRYGVTSRPLLTSRHDEQDPVLTFSSSPNSAQKMFSHSPSQTMQRGYCNNDGGMRLMVISPRISSFHLDSEQQ